MDDDHFAPPRADLQGTATPAPSSSVLKIASRSGVIGSSIVSSLIGVAIALMTAETSQFPRMAAGTLVMIAVSVFVATAVTLTYGLLVHVTLRSMALRETTHYLIGALLPSVIMMLIGLIAGPDQWIFISLIVALYAGVICLVFVRQMRKQGLLPTE